MIVFPCHVCRTDLSAEDAQSGQLVRCPSCLTTLRVPAAAGAGIYQPAGAMAPNFPGAGVGGGYAPPGPYGAPPGGYGAPLTNPYGFVPNRPAGKRYGFNCGYCSSRLEATESMAAQEGQCPTCGNTIVIPILDRYGRLIDPKTRQIIKQDPHPVHAYAAAGDRAPGILRAKDGRQMIRCPRCQGTSAITANNCKGCGMPFTMEGTTLEAAGTSNGFCVASLVLGIIGLPAACVVLPSVLAIIFGIVGFNQVSKTSGEGGGGKGMAIAGIVCGCIGALIGVLMISRM